MNRLTQLGVNAYRTGNLRQAYRYFWLSVMENPDDLQAWLWSVEVAESDAEKQRCLEQILRLDPGQAAARRALDKMYTQARLKELPHVSPFCVDTPGEDIEESSAAEAVPSQPYLGPYQPSTQPSAGREVLPGANQTGDGLAFWIKQPWWIWAGLGTAVLIALLLAAWLLAQFIY